MAAPPLLLLGCWMEAACWLGGVSYAWKVTTTIVLTSHSRVASERAKRVCAAGRYDVIITWMTSG